MVLHRYVPPSARQHASEKEVDQGVSSTANQSRRSPKQHPVQDVRTAIGQNRSTGKQQRSMQHL